MSTPSTPTTEDPWADLPEPPRETWRAPEDPLPAEDVEEVGTGVGDALVWAGEDLLLASPDRLRAVVAAVRTGLLARVRAEHAAAADRRTQAGPRPAPSDLLAEAQVMARAHESLSTLGKAFTDLSREPAALLADAMHDHLGEARRSMKVGTPDGAELALSIVSASSKVSVDEDVVLDVLGTATIRNGTESAAGVAWVTGYAAGVRDGVAALRRLLGSSPGWKSSALEALVRELEQADEGALAARLSGAFARVGTGEPTPKLTISYTQ